MRITSSSNPLVKSIRRAVRRSGPTHDGAVLAESPRLLEEAIASGLATRAVILADGAAPSVRHTAERLFAGCHTVPDQLFAELSSTDHSQGLISLIELPHHDWAGLFAAQRLVVLDGVQDPGNAGAIVRCAEAFGAGGVVFGPGSASPENPKTLRAAAGSLFRLPFVKELDVERLAANLRLAGKPIAAAAAHEGLPLAAADLSHAAIVIGSESHGVSPQLTTIAQVVHIPVEGVESLNAAAAAAVILYAAREQAAQEEAS